MPNSKVCLDVLETCFYPRAVGAAIGTMKALREYCASTLGGRYYVVAMIVFLPKHFSFLGETF